MVLILISREQTRDAQLSTDLFNLQQFTSFDWLRPLKVLLYNHPEIDLILSAPSDKPDPDDSFEMSDAPEATSRPGSLWQLGRHRILCASSIERGSYSRLLGTKRAGVVFVDPPYNVPIDGHVSGNGSVRHREFQMACLCT
jgi:hypothetical protein